MHVHYPTLDFCTLCQIIGGEKAALVPVEEQKLADHNDVVGSQAIEEGPELDTDTIIIGNGPAGIALSAMLDGWHPFYDERNPHPNEAVHEQLLQTKNKSLLHQDLTTLADLTRSELNSNLTPFAALYDALARPLPADTSRRTCLNWSHLPAERIPHIVLGDTPIGGSWTGYDDEMTTVSISSWMDLPGYSLAFDFVGDPAFAERRPNARTFKHYLMAYCLMMGIDQNFRPFTQVTQMQKFCHQPSGQEYWELRGAHTLSSANGQQQQFTLRCRNVVLACGQSHPRLLGVPGELDDTVVYELNSLKRRIAADSREPSVDPVVVVGDGISAADAVLCALNRGCPVLHVIRRNEHQLKTIMLSRLAASVYPEYSRIYELMTGRSKEANYRRMTGTNVRAIAGNELTLETPSGMVQQRFQCLAICIGRRSELPLLKDSSNLLQFSTSYQSTADQSLFAIGAMAGDHFVRYLVGGSLCVAQTLLNNQRERRRKEGRNKSNKSILFNSCCCLAEEDEANDNSNQQLLRNNRVIGGLCCQKKPLKVIGVGIPRTNSAVTPLVHLSGRGSATENRLLGRAKSTMQLNAAVM